MSPHPLAAALISVAALSAVWPATRIPGLPGRALGAVSILALLLVTPLFGVSEPYQVWLLAVCEGTFAIRAYDYLRRHPRAGTREASLGRALVYLVAWPNADIATFLQPLRGPGGKSVLVHGITGVAKVLLGGGLILGGYRLGLPARSSMLDHGLNLLEIYCIGSGASDLVVAFWALLGFHHPDGFDHLFRSRSILEFWSRYDRWIFVWLKHHVFERVGRRHPARAVMATFAVSGALHLMLFAEAAPSAAGYQIVFFLLQGIGALGFEPASRKLRRSGRVGALAGRAITIGFLGVSSLLFMRSIAPLASLHGRTGAWLAELTHLR